MWRHWSHAAFTNKSQARDFWSSRKAATFPSQKSRKRLRARWKSSFRRNESCALSTRFVRVGLLRHDDEVVEVIALGWSLLAEDVHGVEPGAITSTTSSSCRNKPTRTNRVDNA